jgi:plasmid rolling circle replication initiator protein Rep
MNELLTVPFHGTKLSKKCENFTQKCENFTLNNKSEVLILDKLAVSSKINQKKSDVFKKRAKAKYITNGFIIDLANLKSPLEKSYWNTFHCVENLLYNNEDKKIISKYCKNRWCLVCNRIRTGKLMNLYFNEFSKYNDLYFVTLTIKNIPENMLPGALRDMQKSWNTVRFKFKYKKLNFDGIRKNECTYNLKENTYHPHFHVVIQGESQAKTLLSLWLNLYKNDAVLKAQDIRKCDSDTLKELFKYFTKIVKRDKSTPKNEYPIFIHPLDIMNQAYYKAKVFNPFGKFRNLKIEDIEDIEELKADELNEMYEGNIWEWVQDQSDWVSEYGELLTNNDYHSKLKVIIK